MAGVLLPVNIHECVFMQGSVTEPRVGPNAWRSSVNFSVFLLSLQYFELLLAVIRMWPYSRLVVLVELAVYVIGINSHFRVEILKGDVSCVLVIDVF